MGMTPWLFEEWPVTFWYITWNHIHFFMLAWHWWLIDIPWLINRSSCFSFFIVSNWEAPGLWKKFSLLVPAWMTFTFCSWISSISVLMSGTPSITRIWSFPCSQGCQFCVSKWNAFAFFFPRVITKILSVD